MTYIFKHLVQGHLTSFVVHISMVNCVFTVGHKVGPL